MPVLNSSSQSDLGHMDYPPDDGSKAFALIQQIRVLGAESKYNEAAALCEEAIAEAKLADAPLLLIWSLSEKAVSCAILGRLQVAFATATEAHELARAHGDKALEARALLSVAFIALETSDEPRAQEMLERSLACAQQADSPHDAFWALNNLSHIYGEQAQRLEKESEAQAQALNALEDTAQAALALTARTKNWAQRTYAVLNLANAALIYGDRDEARKRITRYTRLARINASPRLILFSNIDFARLYLMEGQYERALAMIDTPEHLGADHLTDDFKLRTFDLLAELYQRTGRIDEAFDYLQKARRVERRMEAFRAERQVAMMTAKLAIEEARAEAEHLKMEAATLALHNQILEQDRDALKRDATVDPLTGLGNRRAADRSLRRHMEEAGSQGTPFSLAYLDVDHFKRVNDTFGHQMGDQVLIAIAKVMQLRLRGEDEVFRYGGEEFVTVLPGHPADASKIICERLRDAVEAFDWASLDPELHVTASIGLAVLQSEASVEALLARADAALYVAKARGRNRVVVG